MIALSIPITILSSLFLKKYGPFNQKCALSEVMIFFNSIHHPRAQSANWRRKQKSFGLSL